MFATPVVPLVPLVPVVPVVKEVTQDIQVKQVKRSVAKAKESAASMERYAFLFYLKRYCCNFVSKTVIHFHYLMQ